MEDVFTALAFLTDAFGLAFFALVVAVLFLLTFGLAGVFAAFFALLAVVVAEALADFFLGDSTTCSAVFALATESI